MSTVRYSHTDHMNKKPLKLGGHNFGLPHCFGGFRDCVLDFHSDDDEDDDPPLKGHIARRVLHLSEPKPSAYSIGWDELKRDAYDERKNPGGVINLGLAENRLSTGLLEKWIKSHPDAMSFLSRDGAETLQSIAGYREYNGIAALRQAIANLMGIVTGSEFKFDPENVIVTSGASAAVELITFCLADPGNSIITPVPSYPGFDRDVAWRANVALVPAYTNSKLDFVPTAECLEEAWQSSKSSGHTPRALLISNPCNPCGFSYTRETLEMLLAFVRTKDIHLISDEIYAGSVFSEPPFVSIVDVMSREAGDFDRVHVVYGLAKDLSLPGLRTGVLYSWNEKVLTAAKKLARTTSVSNHTQLFLSRLVGDRAFVLSFLKENQRRLREARGKVEKVAKRLGIKVAEGNAGQFVFIDLSCYLRSMDDKGEEDLCRRLVFDAKLNMNPGVDSHGKERGWYRLCFAVASPKELDIALDRLAKFALKHQGEAGLPQA